MKRKHRLIKVLAIILISISFISLGLYAFLTVYVKRNVNYDGDELLFKKTQSWEPTVFYGLQGTANSEKMEVVEIERLGYVRRNICSVDQVAAVLKDGIVAVEDHRFYLHRGVDLKRTFKAALNYIFGSSNKFGASTITQQVIKNISGDNDRTLHRKLSEILRAIHIEQKYSKDEILEVYLNVVPMGGEIYGIGAACREYFGKSPDGLSPAEAATLIGILNAPTAYNPRTNPDACVAKRNRVLSVMLSAGIITEDEYVKGINTPLSVIKVEENGRFINSWYVETAIQEISSDLGEKYGISNSAAALMLNKGGYKVYTNMDVNVQRTLEQYFENTENLPKEISGGLNYSMVVTDSENGEIRAIIGRAGKKRENRILNHATTLHPPASTIKPLSVYAPLIDSGKINWATVIDDTPEAVSQNGRFPHNSPDVYDGLTTVKDAIRLSKNTVAVKLFRELGTEKAFDQLKNNIGFSTLVSKRVSSSRSLTDRAVSPLALGQLTDGVSLMELTKAYGVFSGEGVIRDSKTYAEVTDTDGRVILESKPGIRRVFKASTAKIINQLLMTVTDSGTAKAVKLKNVVNTAGKTGTSSKNMDKLFVGYTPYYTAGIWCGYGDGERSVPALSKSHIEIWDEIMLSLHSDDLLRSNRSFSTEGLEYLPYCMDSGEIYSDNCMFDPRGQRMEYGYFTLDNAPSVECHRHVLCDYDSVSKGVADESCPEKNRVKVSLLDISDRAFTRQIIIKDAEFVYRAIDSDIERPDNRELPYFQYALPPGLYVGVSSSKNQFNCAGKIYE